MEHDRAPAPFCVGQWLESDQQAFGAWIAATGGPASANLPLHPALAAWRDAVRSDASLARLFQLMYRQLPDHPPYDCDPYGAPQARDFERALALINVVLTRAPPFNGTGLVGLPINAIIDWNMGTAAGCAAFAHPLVNHHVRQVLHAWGAFLASPASRHVLDDADDGWFGPAARAAMPCFAEEFVCDPGAPFHGFSSWDDFFTRRFRPGVRPVAAPDDDAVIVNACESAPYRLAHGVHARDRFWIKAQPYSMQDMLAGDPLAQQFNGGTVYQAFLSAFGYHRWHSPVSGRVVSTRLVDGTYYSQSLAQGFDPSSPRTSQAYLAQMATRALIFIEADHPGIGLMCVMPVGMAEISTCDITVSAGQRVAKGEQLGMFHFGGSSHCLLFRPEARLAFDLHGQQAGLDASPIPVNARIATVCP